MRLKLSLFFIGLVLVTSLFSEVLAPYAFDAQDIDHTLLGPSGANWMGTDQLGRDIFSRVLFGGRVSLFVAVTTSAFAIFFGTLVGALAALGGGLVDRFVLRSIDVFQSIPTLILMILLSVVFDTFMVIQNDHLRSVLGICVALSLVGWISVARVVRTQVLSLKRRGFVEAARCAGSGTPRIFVVHLLPNLYGSLLVLMSFQIPSHILQESFLSFLGLGLQPPYSSWGVLIHEGWRTFQVYPHLILGPGLVLFGTILALNTLGDELRRKINPTVI